MNIKYLSLICFLLGSSVLFFTSCESDDPDNDNELEATWDVVSFTKDEIEEMGSSYEMLTIEFRTYDETDGVGTMVWVEDVPVFGSQTSTGTYELGPGSSDMTIFINGTTANLNYSFSGTNLTLRGTSDDGDDWDIEAIRL